MDPLGILSEILGRHTPSDGTHDVALPGVKLIRSSTPTMPMPVVYEPTLCLVAQGRKRVMLGTTAHVYDPATYLIASVDLPVMGSVIEASPERPYLCLQIDLDMSELGDLAIRHPAPPDAASTAASGLVLNETTPALLDAAARLAALLDSPRDMPALAPLTTREILYRLLSGPGGSILRHMAQADSRLNQIGRAIVWLRSRYREACRIDDAAAIAGMSRSAFHAHFRAVTSMSPIEFRTQLRLQEARRLMVADAMDAATAGFHVGYDSPSQFTRDYGRVFGMSPAKDAKRLRAKADPSPRSPEATGATL